MHCSDFLQAGRKGHEDAPSREPQQAGWVGFFLDFFLKTPPRFQIILFPCRVSRVIISILGV